MTEHSLWRFSRALHRAINERQQEDLEALIDDDVDSAIHGHGKRCGLLRRSAPKKKQRVKALIFPSFFFASQAAVAMGRKVTSKPSRVIWFTSRLSLI